MRAYPSPFSSLSSLCSPSSSSCSSSSSSPSSLSYSSPSSPLLSLHLLFSLSILSMSQHPYSSNSPTTPVSFFFIRPSAIPTGAVLKLSLSLLHPLYFLPPSLLFLTVDFLSLQKAHPSIVLAFSLDFLFMALDLLLLPHSFLTPHIFFLAFCAVSEPSPFPGFLHPSPAACSCSSCISTAKIPLAPVDTQLAFFQSNSAVLPLASEFLPCSSSSAAHLLRGLASTVSFCSKLDVSYTPEGRYD